MRALPFSILLVAAPALAQELQYHEVSAEADVSIESGTNTSTAGIQYTLTPEGIDRQDEVIPALRRFVRHPSSAWVRIYRKGSSSIESGTAVAVGGVLHVLDGALYASGDIGLQRNDVLFDDFMGGEDHYDSLPFHLELGGRPTPLLSLGAYYAGEPVIGSEPGTDIPVNQVTRTGGGKSVGGVVALSTPDDRLYLRVTGWYHFIDWTFKGFHPGDITVRGPGATVQTIYQLSAETGMGLRASASREHWVDERMLDNDPAWIGRNLDRQVWNVEVDADFLFWWRARFGFHVFVGGGYMGAPPFVTVVSTGFGKFGGGITARF